MTTEDHDGEPDPLLPLVQRAAGLYEQGRLDEAVAVFRQVVAERLPERDPVDAANLGFVLQVSYDATRDLDVLRESIDHATFGLAAFDGAGLDLRLERLRTSWRLLFDATDDPAALAGFVDVSRRLAENGDPARLEEHGEVLFEVRGLTGDPALLAELVEVERRLVPMAADEEKAFRLLMFGIHLHRLHEELDEPGLLDEAITVLRAGVEIADEPELRAHQLSELASALRRRSAGSGDLVELHEAAALLREAAGTVGDPGERGRMSYNLGSLLTELADRTGAYEPLSEAVDAYRLALPLATGKLRLDCVSDLTTTMVRAGVRSGRQDLVTEASAMARAELARSPKDTRAESGLWHVLIRSLYQPWATAEYCLELLTMARETAEHPGGEVLAAHRWDRLNRILVRAEELTEDAGHLDEAVDAGREALALLPPGSRRNFVEANLAIALREAAAKRNDAALAEEAVSLQRLALAHTPPEDPDHASMRGDLAAALFVLDRLAGDPDRLAEAVDHASAAVDGAADADMLALHLPNLVAALHQLAFTGGDPAVADMAVNRYRQALALAPPHERRRRAAILANYASLLRFRAAERDDAAAVLDVRAAIDALAEALALLPDGRPELAEITALYSDLHVVLLALDGSDGALEQAITGWETTLERAGAGGWDEVVTEGLVRLHHGHVDRYHRGHQVADVDRAIECMERALESVPPGAAERPGLLADLGLAFRIRFGATGALADLDRAVTAGAAAIAETGPDDPGHAGWLAHQSAHHRERFRETGDRDDLARAVDLARTARELAPDDRAALNHLAAALGERYHGWGDAADLSESIDLYRDAYDATDPDERSADHSVGLLNNLAIALMQRYTLFAIESDLAEAVDAVTTVLELTPATHPEYGTRLVNASQAYRHRSRGADDDDGAADFETALGHARAAVRHTHPGSARHMLAVSALLGIHAGGDERESAAFEEAVALGLETVRTGDGTEPGWTAVAHNTASALIARWEATEQRADLDLAIEISRMCLHAADPQGPAAAQSAQQLGEALAHRAELAGSPDDRQEASELLHAVASSTTTASRLRYQAARVWLAVAPRDDPAVTIAGCRLLLELLAVSAWPGSSREAQESWLTDTAGTAGQVARLALDVGDPEAAVELLEQGRAVLWSHMLDSRSDLAAIAAADPELAERMRVVRQELDRLAPEQRADPPPDPADEVEPPDPDRMEALRRVMELREEGDIPGALAALGDLAGADDPWTVAAAESGRGIILRDEGDRDGAKAAFTRAMACGVGLAAVAALALGDLLLAENDFAGARAAYERAVEMGDDDGRDRLQALALAEGRSSETSRFVDALIAEGDPEAMVNGLVRMYRDGEYVEARVLAEHLMEILTVEGQAAVGGIVSVVRGQAGDAAGARTALEIALTGPEESVGGVANALGDLLICEYTVEEARTAYERAAASSSGEQAQLARSRLALLAPPRPLGGGELPALFDFGRHLAHLEPDEEAVAVLEAALDAGDPRARTQFYLAEIGPAGPDAFRRVIALAGPDDAALVLVCRGHLRHVRGDRSGSRAAFEAAYRRSLASGDAELAVLSSVYLAHACEEAGDLPEARAAYERAIRAGHPHHSPTAAVDYAGFLAETGDRAEAHGVYRRAIATGHPVQAGKAAIALGESLAASGDHAAARDVLTLALNGPSPVAADIARELLGRLPG